MSMFLSIYLCCWRICLVCLALEFVGPCMVLGFSVDMEAFDELLLINVSWIQEFSGVLRIWTSAGFQAYSYSSLKASLSIEH